MGSHWCVKSLLPFSVPEPSHSDGRGRDSSCVVAQPPEWVSGVARQVGVTVAPDLQQCQALISIGDLSWVAGWMVLLSAASKIMPLFL